MIRKVAATIILLLLIHTSLSAQGYLMLAGGGSEQNDAGSWSEEPYGWFVEKANGGKIVVLSNGDTSPWIPDYFLQLGAGDVINLNILDNPESQIVSELNESTGVFIKGGNQQNYIDAWLGQPVGDAIKELFENGGVVGGTSAGAMITGTYVSSNTEERGSNSIDNLTNPFNRFNDIHTGFLDLLPNAVVDTHYFERGRVGRLLGFMGRIQADFEPARLFGLGVDDRTAVMITPDNTMQVSGSGGVHWMIRDAETTIFARPNQQLSVTDMKVHQLTHGFKIDLGTGEILEMPDDAEWVEARGDDSYLGRMSVTPLFWNSNYLNQLNTRDDESEAWVVLTSGEESLVRFEGLRELITIVDFEEEMLADEAWMESLFDGIRLFTALNYDDSELFFGSAEIQELADEYDGVIEALSAQFTLMGEAVSPNISSDEYASYDGVLETETATGFLPGVILIDSTYTDPDFFENRSAATGWLMRESGAHIGINYTQSRNINLADGELLFPNTLIPAIVLDASEGYYTAASPFNVSNFSSATRNAAAVSSARLSVVREGESFVLYEPERDDDDDDNGDTDTSTGPMNELPSMFEIRKAYPNPFNPSTTLLVDSPEPAKVALQVYNMAGQMVYSRSAFPLMAGANSLHVNLEGKSSGVYLVRVSGAGHQSVIQVSLVK